MRIVPRAAGRHTCASSAGSIEVVVERDSDAAPNPHRSRLHAAFAGGAGGIVTVVAFGSYLLSLSAARTAARSRAWEIALAILLAMAPVAVALGVQVLRRSRADTPCPEQNGNVSGTLWLVFALLV